MMHGNIYSFYTINTTRRGSSGVYFMNNCIPITSSFRDTVLISYRLSIPGMLYLILLRALPLLVCLKVSLKDFLFKEIEVSP